MSAPPWQLCQSCSGAPLFEAVGLSRENLRTPATHMDERDTLHACVSQFTGGHRAYA
ncbi:MAG TPA: hypothetical protein VIG85_01245 [Comamonas sp.]